MSAATFMETELSHLHNHQTFNYLLTHCSERFTPPWISRSRQHQHPKGCVQLY